MSVLPLISVLILCLTVELNAKVYERCALAKELYHDHHFPRPQIKDWMCIFHIVSDFDTNYLGSKEHDGSRSHGLFQVSCRSNVRICSKVLKHGFPDKRRPLVRTSRSSQRVSHELFAVAKWQYYRCRGLCPIDPPATRFRSMARLDRELQGRQTDLQQHNVYM